MVIKALLMHNQMHHINKKDVAKAVLNKDSKTFVVYVAILTVLPEPTGMTIHPFWAI